MKGIDKLEEKAPIIKEQPTEIINQAKTKVINAVQPRIDRVCELRKAGEQRAASLKELSYNKANEVLATHYGSMAVSSVDSTAALAERLLDSFFPKNENDETEEDDSEFIKNNFSILIKLCTLFRANFSNRRSRTSHCSDHRRSIEQSRSSCLSQRAIEA